MREIKFRAKRIDNDRWVYGQYFKTPLTDENSGTTPEAGWFFLTGETRQCIVQDHVSFVIDINTLGQFTGFKDEFENEIYEGDILKDKFNQLGKVFFKNGSFRLTSTYKGINDENFFDIMDLDLIKLNNLEVIGNVYENTHLLK